MSNQSEFGEFEAAQTALKIVERVGSDYGKYKAFEGKNYVITKRTEAGKNPEVRVIAKDGRGEILKFNNKEFISNLQEQDLKVFAQLELKLNQDRSRQLPSASNNYKANPIKETGQTVKSQTPAVLGSKGGVEVAQTAVNLVKLLGEDYGSHKTFKGKNYIITQTKSQAGQSPELTVIAKDGRGEILKFNNRGLTSNLQEQDLRKFGQMSQKISEYLSKQAKKTQHQEEEMVR